MHIQYILGSSTPIFCPAETSLDCLFFRSDRQGALPENSKIQCFLGSNRSELTFSRLRFTCIS